MKVRDAATTRVWDHHRAMCVQLLPVRVRVIQRETRCRQQHTRPCRAEHESLSGYSRCRTNIERASKVTGD